MGPNIVASAFLKTSWGKDQQQCQQQQDKQLEDEGLSSKGVVLGSEWEALLRARLQLAAIAAAAAAGQHVVALCDAETVVKLCSQYVATTASRGGVSVSSTSRSSSSRERVTSTEAPGVEKAGAYSSSSSSSSCGSTDGLAGVLQWQALELYIGGLWHLVQSSEALGNPEDALRWAKELKKVARRMCCCWLSALAAAASSYVYGLRGDVEKAAADAAAADTWWQQLQEDRGAATVEASCGRWRNGLVLGAAEKETAAAARVKQQCLEAYVHTWVVRARAGVASAVGDATAAAVLLQEGVSALSQARTCSQELEVAAGGNITWNLMQLQSGLWSSLAGCQAEQGAAAQAVGVLQEAVGAMEEAAEYISPARFVC
jgi:hypothetical protein